MAPNGFGILPTITFPAPFRSSTSFTPANIFRDVARKLYPNQEAEQKRWMAIHQNDLLDEGKIEDLVAALRAIELVSPELSKRSAMKPTTLTKKTERMRYRIFRARHLFAGSGVIEVGKTITGSRCKQSGMFLTVRGANSILALRCSQFNSRFEDYWAARRAA